MLRDDKGRLEDEIPSGEDITSAFRKGIERGKKHHRDRYKRTLGRGAVACALSFGLLFSTVKIYPAAAMELRDVPIIGDIIKLFRWDKNMERAAANGYITEFENIDEGDFQIKYAMRDKNNLVFVLDIREDLLKEELMIGNFKIKNSYGEVILSRERVFIEDGKVIKIDNFHDVFMGSDYVKMDNFNQIKGENTISGEVKVFTYDTDSESIKTDIKVLDIIDREVDFDLI